jgi:hypothetical protein
MSHLPEPQIFSVGVMQGAVGSGVEDLVLQIINGGIQGGIDCECVCLSYDEAA